MTERDKRGAAPTHCRRSLSIVRMLVLSRFLPTAAAGFHHDEEAAHQLPGAILVDALPNATGAEAIMQSFVQLLRQQPTADSLFRQHAKEDGTQVRTLKQAELRGILEHVGLLGDRLLDEAAFAMVQILDRDGDAGVSQDEWSTALRVLHCWVPSMDAAAPVADASASLLLSLGRHIQAVSSSMTVRSVLGLLEELHTCSALLTWWDGGSAGGWAARLVALERASPVAQLLRLKKWVCAGRLPDRLLTHTDLR